MLADRFGGLDREKSRVLRRDRQNVRKKKTPAPFGAGLEAKPPEISGGIDPAVSKGLI